MSRPPRGFTLVELVMVIALSGVVAVMIGTVLSRPLQGYVDQSRRGELVALAAGALNRITRDVRLAVPNSLRLSSDGQTLQLLLISAAGRYRPNRTDSDGLRFGEAAGDCNSSVPGGDCSSLLMLDPAFDLGGARWLVVYNVGSESGGAPVSGANLWAGGNPGTITPTGTTFSLGSGAPAGETLVRVGNLPSDGFRFSLASPEHRAYFASEVVNYRCNGTRLVRFTDTALPAVAPDSAPASASPLADSLSRCRFTYQPGTTQRAGLLTLQLAIAQDGETLELLQQVHVDNAP
jgi:MSHA biogenesis protein MshO